MSDVSSAGLPNTGADPAKRGQDQVDEGTQNKQMERAELVAQRMEEKAENAVTRAKKEPCNQTGGQEITGGAHKAEDWNSGKKAENRGSCDISLQCKTFEKRNMIGDNQPGQED